MANMKNSDMIKMHLDGLAKDYDKWKKKNEYFYESIKKFLKRQVIPGSSVLEIGCRTGDMLASVEPERGVGLDISEEMIKIAAEKYPKYDFICETIDDYSSEEKFDYILLINVLGYINEVTLLFDKMHRFCHPRTKIILITINPWWDTVLTLSEKLKVKMPSPPHNFLEKGNLTKIIDALDYAINYSGYLLLCPIHIPVLSFLANTIFTRTWGIRSFSFVQYLILRALPDNSNDMGYGCSVVIPCYDEAGNIEEAVRSVPKMGKETEIIVVNDGSKDNTAEIVKGLIGKVEGLRLVDYSPNRGKGYAVQQGFDAATQEVMMILDADMAVPPEELPRFFDLMNKGVCGFVNGTRMVYPMQNNAMKLMNVIGNKLFSFIMSFLTGQHLTDTLCGTKALYKSSYNRIQMGRDKWGDFDLLFGAAKNGDKIMEVPVHYKSRKANKSKMKSFSHGLHLLQVCYRGFKELVLGL